MKRAPIDPSLCAALAPRFELVSVLGQGAMATVYLARETSDDRHVALKVLAESYHGTIEAERFRREARVLTTLHHPNILRAYDVGRLGAHDWYSMPFVQGESLRERLDRERRLSIDESCRVAIDILAALAHSHASEIVHRDVKPDNVLLAEHGALLADFGIARRVELPDSRVPTVATAHGVTMGTPAYMSPEQIAAERSIDGRSDVYSTAVLLYECLSGTLPITGKSARDFMARHMAEAPVPLLWVAPDVPGSIAQAVERGLAKSPGDRFESASAFQLALAEGLRQAPATQTSSYGVPAVAVSPPTLNGLPQDRWIALGVAEAIVSDLRAGKTRVIDEYGRTGAPGARWRIGGECTVAGVAVRVALSIEDRVSGGTHALDAVEGHAAEFPALRRAVTRQVRRFLSRHGLLGDGPANAGDEGSALAEALFLRGCAAAHDIASNANRTAMREAMTDAVTCFERAIQQAPHHVRALEGLAGSLLWMASNDAPDALRRVIGTADLALAIDGTAPSALYHKGVALARLGEWTDAIECLERAVAADPERHEAHYALGRCRLMEALCSPVWEQVGRAVRPLRRAIALDNGHLPAYRELAAVYLFNGNDDEALVVLGMANEAAQSAELTRRTPASGLDTLHRLVHTVRDPRQTPRLLLAAVRDTSDGVGYASPLP